MSAPPRLVLLDSGGANLGSVQAAFARLGVDAPVTSDWNRIRDASHVVLPGVGAAGACMKALRANGLDKVIPKLTQVAGFEWGTGFYINPVTPEEAAKFLREAEL